MLEASCTYYDRRHLEIGRTDSKGVFHPAKPGGFADVRTNKMRVVERMDWQLFVYDRNENLVRAAEGFLKFMEAKN